MHARLLISMWAAALGIILIANATAQDELSKEEVAQLKLFDPWGNCGPIRTFPKIRTNELALTVRKDPAPAEAHLPADLCERMTSVYFPERISDEHIDIFFATFPKVKSIMVGETAWSPRIGIKAIELKGLKELWVPNCDLAPDDLKAIDNLDSLEVLMLSGNKRIGTALDSLSHLTQLRHLSLSGVPIPEFRRIKWLTYNTNLTNLNLSGTGIGDEAVSTLMALPKLTVVTVDDKMSPERQEELYEHVRTNRKKTKGQSSW